MLRERNCCMLSMILHVFTHIGVGALVRSRALERNEFMTASVDDEATDCKPK